MAPNSRNTQIVGPTKKIGHELTHTCNKQVECKMIPLETQKKKQDLFQHASQDASQTYL